MSKHQTNTKKKSTSTTTRDAIEIIERTIIGDDSELRDLVEQATINARVAGIIYDARKAAGLTQQQLAELIGTRQSVISQLEDSDYDGHSLSMLTRIAKALGGHIDIRFIQNRTTEAVTS